jgi:hypothetical protein
MSDDREMPDRVWCEPTGLWLADDGIGVDQSSHRWTAYFSEHFREAETAALREQLAQARSVLGVVRDWADQANPAGYGGLPERIRSVVDCALARPTEKDGG